MGNKKWLIFIPLALAIIYLIGPKPTTPIYDNSLPSVPVNAKQLELEILKMESNHKIKPDNEARIIWAADDSIKQKTEYAIVYLHGFSASQGEGDPVHRNIARKFNCNLYLSRLSEHGIDTTEQLLKLTADKYWESAKTALAIGKQLGHKVILMGTSTGASLALMLAAHQRDISALILLSPNIEINDPNAWILNSPWGLQIARTVVGSKYIYSEDKRPETRRYWSYPYRIEAAVELQELIETTMTPKTFNQVTQPMLMLYYYKDKVHQDSVVRVDAMLKMFDEVGTPDSLKKSKALPSTGNHVIGSPIKSKDPQIVEREIEQFFINTLNIRPKDNLKTDSLKQNSE